MNRKLYRATWDDPAERERCGPIYENEPHDNLFGHLPLGAVPTGFDGPIDDPWDGAHFTCPSGRTLTVRRQSEVTS